MSTRPATRGTGAWGKVLIGCGGLLGLAVLSGLGLLAYGLYWAVRPGRQLPTALAVGPDSIGVVRLERGDEDAGMRALLEAALEAFEAAQLRQERKGLPPPLAVLREWQFAQPRTGLGWWIPQEATLSLEADAEGKVRPVAAVNLQGFVRPIAFALRRTLRSDRRVRAVTHRGHEVFVSRGPTVCFADGTLLFAEDEARLTSVLDREASGATPGVPASVRDLAGRFDVYGGFDRPGEAAGVVGALALLVEEPTPAMEPVVPGLVRSRFGVDVVTGDAARGVLELHYETPEAAAAALPGLEGLLGQLAERATARGLAFTRSTSGEGPRLQAELRLSGIRNALNAAADKLFEEAAAGETPR